MNRRVALATSNPGKLAELRRLVAGCAPGLEVVGLAQLPPYQQPAETETTFEGNARLKARACAAATGLPALADDSGLAVDALNGMPGVRSARWAGPGATDADNNALLLRQLSDLPPERRTARFLCAVALVLPDGREFVRQAELPGCLIDGLRGQNGFGYDPMFVADGQTRTNGELSAAEKDAISHRGKALRAIVPVLLDALRTPPEDRP